MIKISQFSNQSKAMLNDPHQKKFDKRLNDKLCRRVEITKEEHDKLWKFD
jgi:hypothetical protein